MESRFELAYLGIEIARPSDLTRFFSEIIGLSPVGGASADDQRWRTDAKAYRVTVAQGGRNDARFIGLEYPSDDALHAAADRLEAAGFSVTQAGDELAALRRVRRILTTTAPWGVGVELVVGLAEAETPYESMLVPGGFKTDGLGFGHVVFATPAYDESLRFVTEGLGMGQSDWMETEVAPGFALTVHFFHANPRHHTIALAKAPFELPACLHHFMVETNERDDVGGAFDRAWASGLPIPNGLGRHDNDEMFSFYVKSPVGFDVEVGHGARLVTSDWDDDRMYTRISRWGHQPAHVSAPDGDQT